MRSIDIRVDVTSAIHATGLQEVVGTVHLPDDFRPAERQVILFISPGGGYSRHYFNMHFPGHEGYAEAEYHTGREIVVVAIDHLGVGESSLDLINELTVERGADANTAFVREVLRRFADGTVAEDVPAIIRPFVVGAGQSMGAGMTIVMQSRSSPFDAIIVLGKSALHTADAGGGAGGRLILG